jgi:hypothetical protein
VRKTQGHAQPAARRQRLAAGQQHIGQHHVERNHGQNQRGQPAGDGSFSIDLRDIAGAEQEQPNHPHERHGLRRPEDAHSAPTAPAQQNCTGNQESRSGHQQRRHLLRSDADGRIGGAPEKVDAEKRQNKRSRGGFFLSREVRTGCGISHGDTFIVEHFQFTRCLGIDGTRGFSLRNQAFGLGNRISLG